MTKKKAKKTVEAPKLDDATLDKAVETDPRGLSELGLDEEQAKQTKGAPKGKKGRPPAGTAETRRQPDKGPEVEMKRQLLAKEIKETAPTLYRKGVQKWEEPYPEKGLVLVRLTQATRVTDPVNPKISKMHDAGTVIELDALTAHSLHRTIEGV